MHDARAARYCGSSEAYARKARDRGSNVAEWPRLANEREKLAREQALWVAPSMA